MASPKTIAPESKHSGSLKLLGGRLCLDFVNTVEWWDKRGSKEYLKSYHDLVVWGRHAGILNYQEARILSQRAYECRSEADRALNRGLKLRKSIYQLFSAIIAENKVSTQELILFNEHLAITMRSVRILDGRGGFRWDVTGDKNKLDWFLNFIVYSAAELLVSDELKKVKACFNPFCGWLFFDGSRNQSRRWCDMKDCGNRAKALRFYNKKQGHNELHFRRTKNFAGHSRSGG
jgi:predicted RNA-binding Zn ribbon-like protein